MKKGAAVLFLSTRLLWALPQAGDEHLPEFEVASVKQTQPPYIGVDIKVLPGGTMVASNASLQQLLAGAYGGLELYQVVGPAWIADTRFNIEAKPPENDFGQQPTVVALGRQIPLKTTLRLRSLLIARFKLETHFEMRDHGVYDLVVARSGSKLREIKDPTNQCRGGFLRNG